MFVTPTILGLTAVILAWALGFVPTLWGVLASVSLVGFIGWRVKYWLREGQRMKQDGYLPPYPTVFGRAFQKLFTSALAWFTIGPVITVNRHYARVNARAAVVPTHQRGCDFMAMGSALPDAFRHLGSMTFMFGVAKEEDIDKAGPVLPAISAFGGLFPVRSNRGKPTQGGGDATVDSMARVLATKKSWFRRIRLFAFPTGDLQVDQQIPEVDRYRTGNIRAMQRARDEYGIPASELCFLPVLMRYVEDPAKATLFTKLVRKSVMKGFRVWPQRVREVMYKWTFSRVIVVFGKPVYLNELPDDPREATNIIRQKHLELVAEADMAEAKL